MKDLVQYVICSNQWFSAVTEYAFQLAVYLKGEGYIVQVLAHHESPLLRKADEHGLYSAAMSIHNKSIFDWVLSFSALFTFLWSLPKNSRSVVWVVEGHEHSLCALLRFLFPTIRKRTVLVRLRGQDRFRHFRKLDQLVLENSDYVVFPSRFAAKKLFSGIKLRQVLMDKILVQPFCKDFVRNSTLLAQDQKHLRLEGILQGLLADLELVSNFAKLNFVSVARFDKVKGLEGLISDFALADFGSQRCRLFLIGRAEALSASDLAQVAVKAFGAGSRVYSKKRNCFVESKGAAKQVLIFEEYFHDLAELISCCQFAVISSQGSEVICRTAVEYMQVALPVLSTDVGSLKETLGNVATIYAEATGNLPAGSSLSTFSFIKCFEEAAQVHGLFNRYAEMCEAAQAQGRQYSLVHFGPLVQKVFAIGSN